MLAMDMAPVLPGSSTDRSVRAPVELEPSAVEFQMPASEMKFAPAVSPLGAAGELAGQLPYPDVVPAFLPSESTPTSRSLFEMRPAPEAPGPLTPNSFTVASRSE